jgi:hypothetical protein
VYSHSQNSGIHTVSSPALTAEEKQWEFLSFGGWALHDVYKKLSTHGKCGTEFNTDTVHLVKMLMTKTQVEQPDDDLVSPNRHFSLLNRGGLTEPVQCLYQFTDYIISHVVSTIKFHYLGKDTIRKSELQLRKDPKLQLLFIDALNTLYKTSATITTHHKPISVDGSLNQCEAYIFTTLRSKIFNSRAAVVTSDYNDKLTSRSVDKRNACTQREFLK